MAGFGGQDGLMTNQRNTQDQERTDLLTTLDKHRGFLRQTVQGMSDEQAAERTTASELCLGGLIKHVARAEQGWTDFIVNGPRAIGPADAAAYEAHLASFKMADGDTLAGLLAAYDEVAAHTQDVVDSLDSLDLSHPLPEAPWFEA